ncbi:phenylalanine--tRNA ligase subunit beta [Scatolibacter rhodanostii]|uniref:phenylalanine--tRNA ligase subunit beta n=1 Tax=Scatolibacter rhodanostii TaxID=2014781 RepID=UPI000C08A323|nr:phenylalanine--tRNA ligase subunit beta [Scatolibacter rhodanostii]
MLISMNWIQEFVDLSGLNQEELIQRFTLSTAEVEGIEYKGRELRDVVAGKILSVEKHPDSKKLHLLKVDAGNKIYDVVCGAPNVREGLIVPFVKEGGFAGGMDIKATKIAGYESFGMCCSEAELGISDGHGGLMELPEDTTVGTDITELYQIKDIVFEVDNKSLTNRPDLWGHYGIAREFSALTGRPLNPLVTADVHQYDSLEPVEVKVADTERCFRYCGMKVKNINEKTSPVNMRIRLFYCGTRAINLLADLTNYVMLETSQPTHAFDSRKVNSIEVKRFDKPFTFKTLDGVEREIDENTLMICNEKEPVAIAGIMGGLESEIEDDTDSLLLEAANFAPVGVRKSSSRLGLRTDASMRFEKTLDPEMTVDAIGRILKLLQEIDSGVEVSSRLTDVYANHYPEIELQFDKTFVDRYTGISISDKEIVKTLSALGFGVTLNNGAFDVKVPSWRSTKDVTMKADIIEEITRIYGYDNFDIQTTKTAIKPVRRSAANLCDNFAKDILVHNYHLHEVNSYIWYDSKKLKKLGIVPDQNVRLSNAMTPENEMIRSSMVPSLLTFVQENKGFAASFGIFEIGRVVQGLKEDKNCNERKKLGIVLFSKTEQEKDLFFRLREMLALLSSSIKHKNFSFEGTEAKYDWQHPMNTAKILSDEKEVGFLSVIHPVVQGSLDKKACIVCAEIDMDTFAEEVSAEEIRYQQPSKYPGIDIDLSLWVPEGIFFADMEKAWQDTDKELLKKVSLFDTFVDGGKKSVTLRFSFQSQSKTLTREEVQPQTDAILEKLAEHGMTLKGN